MSVLTLMPPDVDLDVHVEQQTDLTGGIGSAVFDSPQRTRRYLLTRIWDPTTKPLVFLMLNPSTANGMSAASTKIDAWVFARSMMTKWPVFMTPVSTRARSAISWESLPTQSAWHCADAVFRYVTVVGCPSTTRSSWACMRKAARSSRSDRNSASAPSWFANPSTGRVRAAGTQLTTSAYQLILSKWFVRTPRGEARRRWHVTWASLRTASCRFCTITTSAFGTSSMCWTPGRRGRLFLSTGKGTLRRTSVKSWASHSDRSASPSEGWASPRRTVGRRAVRDASAWDNVVLTLAFASKMTTQWRSCGKQVASSLNIGWSWHGTLVARYCPEKPFTTSTTTGTTTESITCNSGSASTGRATSFNVAIAGPTAFNQRLSHNESYGVVA